MKRSLVPLCCTLVLVPAVFGCGGDDDEEGTEGGGAATTEQPGDEGAAPRSARVVMKDISFQPENVTVAEGGTVTWVSEDGPAHDVTKSAGPGPKFSSGTGNLERGDTYEHTFDVAGKIDYVCTVHPGMDGTVTVR